MSEWSLHQGSILLKDFPKGDSWTLEQKEVFANWVERDAVKLCFYLEIFEQEEVTRVLHKSVNFASVSELLMLYSLQNHSDSFEMYSTQYLSSNTESAFISSPL